jgi:hypothetical protein
MSCADEFANWDRLMSKLHMALTGVECPGYPGAGLSCNPQACDCLSEFQDEGEDGLVAAVAALRAKSNRTSIDSEMADGCLHMIREDLIAHGVDMTGTPPMMYNDAMRHAIAQAYAKGKAERETLLTDEQRATLQVALQNGEEVQYSLLFVVGFSGGSRTEQIARWLLAADDRIRGIDSRAAL